MIEEFLKLNEGKTLEFKENSENIAAIIRTVTAFANTAGGIIVLGIRDKTKEIIGIKDVLKEELRLANAIADSIAPIILPDIEIITYRSRELIIVRIPHSPGPCYLKSIGPEHGTYLRIGSSNRAVDQHFFQTLTLVSKNLSYDELPHIDGDKQLINWDLAIEAFRKKGKKLSKNSAANMGIFIEKFTKFYPTNGGVLLFSKDRLLSFPDSRIRCARFAGNSRVKILDQIEITHPLYLSIEPIIHFIRRNTSVGIEIKEIAHTEIFQFPPIAVREAIINSIVHADYSIGGTFINIAIFDDRIEFINPGGLPMGLTLERALSGASKLRNKVIGRVFRELKLIEQWGSGLRRIIEESQKHGSDRPLFEDFGTEFKVTIYSTKQILQPEDWEQKFIEHLKIKQRTTTAEAAEFMDVTKRTAGYRLKKLLDQGILRKIGTSIKDPNAFYVLTHDLFDPDSLL